MNVLGVHLVPETVCGQDQVFVLICEFEMSNQRRTRDVRSCESFEPCEIVLLVFQVVISKGPGRLESSFDVACGFADKNVRFSWKFFN